MASAWQQHSLICFAANILYVKDRHQTHTNSKKKKQKMKIMFFHYCGFLGNFFFVVVALCNRCFFDKIYLNVCCNIFFCFQWYRNTKSIYTESWKQYACINTQVYIYVCTLKMKRRGIHIFRHDSFVHKKNQQQSQNELEKKKKEAAERKALLFFSSSLHVYDIYVSMKHFLSISSLTLPFQCYYDMLGGVHLFGCLSVSSSSSSSIISRNNRRISNVGISRSKHRAHWILERGGVKT